MDTYSSASDLSPSKYQVPQGYKVLISIELYKVSNEPGRKHAKYAIFGSDHLGEFDVYRRYKEFKRLREVLVSKWLGTIIPALPRKKTVVKVK